MVAVFFIFLAAIALAGISIALDIFETVTSLVGFFLLLLVISFFLKPVETSQAVVTQINQIRSIVHQLD